MQQRDEVGSDCRGVRVGREPDGHCFEPGDQPMHRRFEGQKSKVSRFLPGVDTEAREHCEDGQRRASGILADRRKQKPVQVGTERVSHW